MLSKDKTVFVREKIMQIRTGILQDMNTSHCNFPVFAKVLHVEEDGQIWLEVNTKIKNWEQKQNLPLKLQFISDSECHILLSGIGGFVHLHELPDYVTTLSENPRALMAMKMYYGEYILLPVQLDGRTGIAGAAREAYRHVSKYFLGSSNRRLLIFR